MKNLSDRSLPYFYIKPIPFYITLDDLSTIKPNDVLELSIGIYCKVLKVYKRTWWRRLLNWLGFETKMMNIKVIKTTIVELKLPLETN